MLTFESTNIENICLEFELTKSCNLKCSYCCADTQFIKNKLDDELKFNYYKKIIEYFDNKSLKINYILTGGETTDFKYIDELINLINKSKSKDNFLLLTNLTNKIPQFKKEPKNYIVTSLHKEYKKLWDTIIERGSNYNTNYNLLIDKTIPVDWFDDYLQLIKSQNNSVSIQIITGSTVKEGLHENFKIYEKWYEHVVINNNMKLFNDVLHQYKINRTPANFKDISKIYLERNNNFKNCVCYFRNYMIMENLDIREDCGDFKVIGNLLNDFNDIDLITFKKRLCPNNKCDLNSTFDLKRIITH